MADNNSIANVAQGAATGAAVGGPWGAVIGAGAPIIGGVLGNMFGGSDQSEADKILREIYQQYMNLQTPDITKMQMTPEMLQLAGTLDPTLEQAAQLGATDAFQNIQLDPRLRKNQMDQLEALSKIAASGFTPEDRAALQLASRQADADATARMQALLQQQEMRGVGSSDAALAMRQAANQSEANRAAEAALKTQLEARNRAMQAMTQSASLAGAIESSEYGRASDAARALNEREAQNIAYQNAANQRNVASQNAAQEFNLRNRQNIANTNVDLRNQAQAQNKSLYQQQFENELAKLSGARGAATGAAQTYQNAADRTRNMWAGIGSGAGEIAAAFGTNSKSNQSDVMNPSWYNSAQKKAGTV